MDSQLKNISGMKVLASDATADYIVTMTSELAVLARRHGLDTLAYILEVARAEADARQKVHDSRVPVTRSPATTRHPIEIGSRSLDPLADLISINRHPETLEQANQSLQRAADAAAEALEERRQNLREIEKVERSIQRMQALSSRILYQLVDKGQ
jgi:hypothetical protein